MRLALFILFCLFSFKNVYAFINFKPLTKINLKNGNDVQYFFESIEDRSDKCEVKFFHNNLYYTEYINTTISEFDFFEIARIKGMEFNLSCSDLSYEIKDIKNNNVLQKYQLDADICNGQIFNYSVTFHLTYEPGILNSRPGFGANPNLLNNWVNYFESNSNSKMEFRKEKRSDPYKDINGKLYDSYMEVRDWKHKTFNNNGKVDYQIFLSSVIYGNEKLGPVMNRISFSMYENTMKKIKSCNRF